MRIFLIRGYSPGLISSLVIKYLIVDPFYSPIRPMFNVWHRATKLSETGSLYIYTHFASLYSLYYQVPTIISFAFQYKQPAFNCIYCSNISFKLDVTHVSRQSYLMHCIIAKFANRFILPTIYNHIDFIEIMLAWVLESVLWIKKLCAFSIKYI